MRFTHQAEYAIRIMLSIAKTGRKSISSLAAEEGLPRPFASRIAFHLKQAGLVAADRGATGGVYLAKDPQAINILEIIQAVEGRWTVFGCVDDPESCTRSTECPLCGLWSRTQDEMEKVLRGTSLASLLASSPEYAASVVQSSVVAG